MKFKDFPKNVKLRIICGFFDHAISMSIMPFMVLYIADELGKVTSGILLSINVIFGLICNLMSGYYADRFSRKGILISGQIFFTVLIALIALFIHPSINQPYIVTILFMLTAVSGSMIFPAMDALIVDSTTEAQRKYVYVFNYWSNNLATAIGTAIGGLFYKEHRMLLFIIIIIIFILNTIIFMKFLDDPTTRREKKIVHTHWVHDLLKNYAIALKDLPFVMFTIAVVFIYSAEFALTNYIGVRLHHEFKPIDLFGVHVDGVRMMSLMLIENTVLVVTITFLISKLVEPFNPKYVMMVGAMLYAGGYAISHAINTWYLLLLAVLIATIGELMFSPIYSVYQAKLMPDDQRASYIAFSSLGFSGASLVASSGLVIGAYTGDIFMASYVCFLGIIGVCCIFVAMNLHKKRA